MSIIKAAKNAVERWKAQTKDPTVSIGFSAAIGQLRKSIEEPDRSCINELIHFLTIFGQENELSSIDPIYLQWIELLTKIKSITNQGINFRDFNSFKEAIIESL